MADTKISGLPASTTPLAGTEVLPIVQSGATKQVSVANLTAARSVSGLNFVANAGQTTFKGGGFFDDPVLGNDGGVLIGGGPSFLPTNGSGIGTNGAMNLGRNDLRFNNLYLAGNVIVESGQGIDFSATPGTGTSELLADYEEGTFTPVLDGETTSPTVGYSTQFGSYTKIGRVVNFYIRLTLSSLSGGSGNAIITGLPFTVGLSNSPFASAVEVSKITFGVGYTSLSYRPLSAQTFGRLNQFGTTLDSTPTTIAQVSSTADIIISGSYSV
jgi:hypothetical protein